MTLSIQKFNFAEMFNNSQGKTSLALVSGAVLIVTGCVGFIYGAYLKQSETENVSLAFATLGSGLLGIRRFTNDKELTNGISS